MRVKASGEGQERGEFVTQPRSQYRSPYKKGRGESTGRQHELENKLLESKAFSYSSKLKLDKKDTITSTIFMDRINLNSSELSQTASTQGLPNKAFRQTCQAIKKDYNRQRDQHLLEFLEEPRIRNKIFEILQRGL